MYILEIQNPNGANNKKRTINNLIKDNIWHLHSLSTDYRFFKVLGKFECQKADIHFKTQPEPVAKNATIQGLRLGIEPVTLDL